MSVSPCLGIELTEIDPKSTEFETTLNEVEIEVTEPKPSDCAD